MILLSYPSYSRENLQSKVLKYKPNCDHIKHLNSTDELTNLTHTIIYVSLKNKDAFWFYIDSSQDSRLFGFRKVQSRWMYHIVEIPAIDSYF